MDEDKLYELFLKKQEETNTYWEESESEGMHIDIDDIVEATTYKDIGYFMTIDEFNELIDKANTNEGDKNA